MSRFQNVSIRAQDSTSIDAFGRWRVSEPCTLFDSKQIFDAGPAFWDEELESGAGISAAHSVATASTVFSSTLNTAGVYTRQTFMRHNYQPGKSQLVLMTGVLGRSGGGTGVKRRVGIFDDNNGLFFELNGSGSMSVVRRTSVSGAPVDVPEVQASWNIDSMDGSGPSEVTIDWSKNQIFWIDFEWLGTGRVRMGLVIDGIFVGVHQFLNANVLTTVYMSTPNLPLRYQMVTTVASPASTMEAVCASVISEGGVTDLGIIRRASTSGAHVDVATENVLYAIVGIRLKATHIAATIKILSVSIAEHVGGKEYEWVLLFNPIVAGAFTYADQADSSVQTALGATVNVVTLGTQIGGGFGSSASKGGLQTTEEIDSARRLGAKINGTVDTIILAVRAIGGSSNIDIEASITWRELS